MTPAAGERDERAGETGAASSSSVCPGCAKPVDALRAGHVAIYDGIFLYYCDASCKAVHLRAIAAHLGDDVPTLDPPAVAERLLAHAAANALPSTKSGTNGHGAGPNGNGTNGRNGNGVSQTRAAVRSEASPLQEPTPAPASVRVAPSITAPPVISFPEPAATSSAAVPSERPFDAALVELVGALPPRTLRSPLPPAPSERVFAPVESVVRAAAPRERVASGISIAGGIAGVLVPLLVIADVGLGARLVLACVAVVALVARLVLSPPDLADANPLLVAAPVVTALVAALASFGARDPHAAAIAVLAGLSASIALLVEEGIARARSDVSLARASIATALAGPSRVLRGDGPSEMLKDVKSGETILVEPGDIVGVDGVVSKGEAIVVPWHDAPLEMTKAEGDAITAGARIVSGRIRVVTAWAGSERAWVRATSSPLARTDVSAPMARFTRALLERAAPAAALLAGLAAMASGGASGGGGRAEEP